MCMKKSQAEEHKRYLPCCTRMTFNDTYYEYEDVDVVLIQPYLKRNQADPLQNAYYDKNGSISDKSFADLPVEANWGLLSIAAALKKRGYSVRYLDLNLFDHVKCANTGERISSEDIAEILQRKRATVYGVSAMTSSLSTGLHAAKIVKHIFPESCVVMGGIHPSLYATSASS